MWATQRNRLNDHKLLIALLGTLILLAWLALWGSDRSTNHGWLLHGLHGLEAFGGSGAFMFIFITGWTVMVVAMMLPTSLPLIFLFHTLTRQRRDRTWLMTLLAGGYLGTWVLFGVVVYFSGSLLHVSVGQSAWLETNTWVLGAGIITLAGLYQFTPLKYHCLEKCRSPLSFITEHWRGSHEASHAFRLGAHHGLFCIGCCWSLMLLMFLVGTTGAVSWMLVLGAVMAVEKNVSWGRRIGVPLGVLLIGAGLALGTAQALQSPGETITGPTAEVSLTPTGGSGVRGVAAFADIPGGVEVELRAWGLPEAGAIYLAHLHRGSCAEDPEYNADEHSHDHSDAHDHLSDREVGMSVGEIEHPLNPLVPESGDASSVTKIDGATVDRLFSGDPGYFVNVHAETSDAGELPTVACTDLREDGEKAIGHDH